MTAGQCRWKPWSAEIQIIYIFTMKPHEKCHNLQCISTMTFLSLSHSISQNTFHSIEHIEKTGLKLQRNAKSDSFKIICKIVKTPKEWMRENFTQLPKHTKWFQLNFASSVGEILCWVRSWGTMCMQCHASTEMMEIRGKVNEVWGVIGRMRERERSRKRERERKRESTSTLRKFSNLILAIQLVYSISWQIFSSSYQASKT